MRRKEKVAYWVNCGALQLCTTQKHVVLLCSHQSDAVVQKRQLGSDGLPICRRERFEQRTTWVPSALANRFCRMMLCYGAMETYNNLCWWQSAAKLYMLQAINMTKTLCMDLVQRGSRDAKPLHLDGIFVSTNHTLCHLMPSERQRKKNIISVDHCYEVWITWEQKWNYIFWSF